MKLEVLTATMVQTDWSLVEKMNLQSAAILANQNGKWDVAERKYPFGTVKMLSSDTIGVGCNRNLALDEASGDILLFADDDVCYYDGLVQGVQSAFLEFPQADVILFSMDISKNGAIAEHRHYPAERRKFYNSLRFGAYCMAIRRSSAEKVKLRFSTLFGGGCVYGSGEDSLFLRDCFKAGLKVYSHNYVLGVRRKDSSSWFEGYNEKFFHDKGALFAALSPQFAPLIALFVLVKNRKLWLRDISFRAAMRLMRSGAADYRKRRWNR